MPDCTSWFKNIDAAFLAQLVALVTAVGLILKTMRDGQTKQAASGAIAAEQQNRYLATQGADPVTMQSPPMGTGDGKVDAAVTDQLAAAPTSPSTVPVVPPAPVAPPPTPKP